MEQKLDSHVFIGMQQDLATSLHDPKYLREAWNIRITPREGHTGQSITNEQGTIHLDIDYEGNYVGHCVLNQYLVLFTTDGEYDYIYRINMHFDDPYDVNTILLYKGHLGFSLAHPLETLASYENEYIQKVYWVDGINQPRMINIAKVNYNEETGEYETNYDDYSFDFVQPLALNEVITIERMVGATGAFPAGVLQYAFTYYNQYGQETNIAYITTLQYVSFNDRGASPEENVAVAFKINVQNVDLRFDYMRIYRIHRSALNGTPVVQRIQDIDLRELESREHPMQYMTESEIKSTFSNNYRDVNSNTYDNGTALWTPGVAAQYKSIIVDNIQDIEYSDYTDDVASWTPLSNSDLSTEVLAGYHATDSTLYNVDETEYENAFIVNYADNPKFTVRIKVAQDQYYYLLPQENKSLMIYRAGDQYSQDVNPLCCVQGKITYKVYHIDGIEHHNFVIDENDRLLPKMLSDAPDYIKHTSYSYIDTGLTGENVDPAKMLYLGGEAIVAGTMCEKDNTLFLGDIEIQRPSIPQEVKDTIKGLTCNNVIRVEQLPHSDQEFSHMRYNYVNTLCVHSAGFKMHDWYRLGVQFQHITGKWSEPVWINDCEIINSPYLTNNFSLMIPSLTAVLQGTAGGQSIFEILYNKGYRKARPVVVFPSTEDRAVVTQGIINPTMYTITQRIKDKGLYSQSSWFFRFLNKTESNSNTDTSTVRVVGGQGKGYLYSENEAIEGDTIQYMDSYLQIIDKDTFDNYNYPESTDPTTCARSTEIEGKFTRKGKDLFNQSDDEYSKYENVEVDKFRVDWNFLTFNSPDIEFDDSTQILQWDDVSARIVGTANNGCCLSDIYMETSTPTLGINAGGFEHKSFMSAIPRQLCSGLFYEDFIVNDQKDSDTQDPFAVPKRQKFPVRWLVYPWQGSGSLNNDIFRPAGKGTRTSELSEKIISNLKSTWSYIIDDGADLNLQGKPELFSGQELTLIKVDGEPYSGNIDTLLIPSAAQGKFCVFNGDTVTEDFNPYAPVSGTINGLGSETTVNTMFESNAHWYMIGQGLGTGTDDGDDDSQSGGAGQITFRAAIWGPHDLGNTEKWYKQWFKENESPFKPNRLGNRLGDKIGDYYIGLARKKPQVRMKYRSTPHLVFRLASPDNPLKTSQIEEWADVTASLPIQPVTSTWWGKWQDQYKVIGQDSTVTYPEKPGSFLPIVELYRYKGNDDLRKSTMFGGQSTDAIMQNFWLPADEAVREYKFNADTKQLTLHFNYGDTWYQRYDCMKTYPMANTDPNQIVEIGSFLLETRVNIDGRYDRNRGQINNTIMSPVNFNKLNRVYSQMDNFFSYKIMDDDFYTLNKFNNQVTWTLEKQAGAQVDPWTQITLTATKDLQGDKGHIASLNTWQDRIFCFQPRAVNEIVFNPRVQIPTTDGTPIEITNGMKLERIVQIADGQGCDNKWAIKGSANGLYFIEEITKNLQVISSKGFEQISEAKNMSRYFENLKNWTWNPLFYSTKLEYDSHNSDLYITSIDRALSFSEKMGEFISYYNYPQMMAMFTIDNDTYSIYEGIRNSWIDENGNIQTQFTPSEEKGIHRMFCGKYNYLYDNTYPYSISFISNAEPALDKIFTNLEMRADLHNSNDEINSIITNLPYEEEYSVAHHTVPFNRIRVFNEYQDTGEKVLSFNIGSVTNNFQKKFRIWRADIPRDQVKKLDRIRNTWACVTLKMTEPLLQFNKVQLNDVMVKYFI